MSCHGLKVGRDPDHSSQPALGSLGSVLRCPSAGHWDEDVALPLVFRPDDLGSFCLEEKRTALGCGEGFPY